MELRVDIEYKTVFAAGSDLEVGRVSLNARPGDQVVHVFLDPDKLAEYERQREGHPPQHLTSSR